MTSDGSALKLGNTRVGAWRKIGQGKPVRSKIKKLVQETKTTGPEPTRKMPEKW